MVNAASISPPRATPSSPSAAENVVPEHEGHEKEHSQKPGAVEHLRHLVGHRPADNRLDGIENEMPAIKRRDGQKIEDADADRQQRNELHEPFETELSGLAGHFGNLDRPPELAPVLFPRSKASEKMSGAGND